MAACQKYPPIFWSLAPRYQWGYFSFTPGISNFVRTRPRAPTGITMSISNFVRTRPRTPTGITMSISD